MITDPDNKSVRSTLNRSNLADYWGGYFTYQGDAPDLHSLTEAELRREVDGIGMGFVIIEKEVFERLPYPWFLEWSPSMPKTESLYRFGEDLWFSDLCKKYDIPIFVLFEGFVGHWAKTGYVVDETFWARKLQDEGFKLN